MASTGGQQQSRLREMTSKIPLCSLVIFGVCAVVYVACNFADSFNAVTNAFSLSPYMIVFGGQWYRIITAAFMHGGLLHIGMNMMSLISMGQSLEARQGTLRFFFLMLLYTLVIGIMYLGVAFAWAAFCIAVWGHSDGTHGGRFPEPVLITGAVGFSGVLFAMAVDETTSSAEPTRSIFGLFSVPSKLYPWILMGIISIILPGVSFLGHFCGILAGCLHAAGALDWALPSMVTLRKLEGVGCLRFMVRSAPYKLVPQQEILRGSDNSLRAQFGEIGSAIATVLRPLTEWCRTRMGRTGSTAATGTSASAAPARRVDDSGRLVSATAPAPPIAAPQQGADDIALQPAHPGLWGTAGAVLSGGSGSGGYVRVDSEEPPAPDSSMAAHGVTPSGSGVDARAAREKALKAAEARLATAKAIGRPQGGSPPS